MTKAAIPATLYRTPGDDQGTLGLLVVADFRCWVLELPDRANRPNRSRIPAGVYDLTLIRARRAFSGFHDLYWIHDVPGRSGILAHPGTFAGDVELGLRSDSWGCLLPGMNHGTLDGQRAVFNSRTAVRWFHEVMQRRPGRLTIREVDRV